MTDVILYGAPAATLNAGTLPAGWEAIRLRYDDGVTDVATWLQQARDAWGASYDFDADVLRAVVLRYAARPTNAALAIRDAMARVTQAAGVRLVLAVPASELTWTRSAVDANPHPTIRTYATTPAQLQAWIDAHPWPQPGNPALGGPMRRVGGGRHVPWPQCITDPVPSQWTPPPEEDPGA